MRDIAVKGEYSFYDKNFQNILEGYPLPVKIIAVIDLLKQQLKRLPNDESEEDFKKAINTYIVDY